MFTAIKRPYVGEADLPKIATLLNTCEAVDRLDEGTSVEELKMELSVPSLDTARDIQLWEDTDRELVGFGSIWIPVSGELIDGYLWFCVHPNARGGDLEAQTIAWGEERMREVGQERRVHTQIRSSAREDQSARITLLEAHKFTLDRYFFDMTRSLHEPIPEPQFPTGFILHQNRGEQDAQAWVELFNQSFIDHWNHHDTTVEDLNHWLKDPHYKPELDLIALAPDGTFAACCYCEINPEDNARTGRNEGRVCILGTHRNFRRIGLGRAMLLSGLHKLKALGVDTACLGVDAKNLTGALGLYESVGFRKAYTRLSYVKDL